MSIPYKKKLRDSYQTFLGLGLGKLFPARESLVSDIPAGYGKLLNIYLQCWFIWSHDFLAVSN